MKTETKQTHTPGPWIVNGRTTLGYRIDALGTELGMEFLRTPISIAPRESDARLIAAAPTMLDALRYAIECYPKLAGSLVEHAIAKAEARS